MEIQVVINGETKAIPPGQTLLALLHHLQLDPARVAVELDRRIIQQPRWAQTIVDSGARIEIVQFVGGG